MFFEQHSFHLVLIFFLFGWSLVLRLRTQNTSLTLRSSFAALLCSILLLVCCFHFTQENPFLNDSHTAFANHPCCAAYTPAEPIFAYTRVLPQTAELFITSAATVPTPTRGALLSSRAPPRETPILTT